MYIHIEKEGTKEENRTGQSGPGVVAVEGPPIGPHQQSRIAQGRVIYLACRT